MSDDTRSPLAAQVDALLSEMGVPSSRPGIAWGAHSQVGGGESFEVCSPIDGSILAELRAAGEADLAGAAAAARAAFDSWRDVPAPVRGELVRRIGLELRRHHEALAQLVTLESGKIGVEARGEVQEMIDLADFAVGLSRQLCGLTMASERRGHRMAELWHPLGPIGVITAFNFPVAVWSWNALLALVCGDPVLWKPSEKTPLCALAVHALASRCAAEFDAAPPGLLQLACGGAPMGQSLAAAADFPLISATGSVHMGRSVAQTVAARLGRSLLELGGNNASVVAPSADLETAIGAIVFAAVGTCGQRCTTLRRLIVHESIYATVRDRLRQAYRGLRIGSPLDPSTQVGPLIDSAAWEAMQRALEASRATVVHGGGRLTAGVPAGGVYVEPALVEVDAPNDVVRRETFAPILYLMPYRDLDQAIALNNAVPQGLSSSIFTRDLEESERFCAASGSDCGLVNVNLGTSGAEIGGAFGGEKETGGGRESGSDAWKNYMRRVTQTVNFSGRLQWAQGIRFDVDSAR